MAMDKSRATFFGPLCTNMLRRLHMTAMTTIYDYSIFHVDPTL